MRPAEVFVSHSSEDRRFVRRLTSVLAEHGIPFFYSKHNLRGAQQWHDEIGAALDRCDWFLLVLSPAAAQSTWVKRELVYALQQERYTDRILPLLYRSCEQGQLSWTLSSFQHIGFERRFDRGCAELLAGWGIGYRRAPRKR